jgi:hypothetical protein
LGSILDPIEPIFGFDYPDRKFSGFGRAFYGRGNLGIDAPQCAPATDDPDADITRSTYRPVGCRTDGARASAIFGDLVGTGNHGDNLGVGRAAHFATANSRDRYGSATRRHNNE